MLLFIVLLAAAAAGGQNGSPAPAAPADYRVGPSDVLSIVVFGEDDLSKTVTLAGDGTFDFPHIGRVQAGGLTARSVGEAVTRALKELYVNPQVSVEVAKFRSQNVIVIGYVNAPGRYSLAGDMSVLEMLAAAGSPTAAAAGHVVISRPAGDGPALEDRDASGSSSLRLTMRQLQTGEVPPGFMLRDGDTIMVPKAESVTVIGHVKITGSVVLETGMTVFDAIARAGGVTDKGALNRVKVLRLIDGKVQPVKGMKLSDRVEAGDTVDVPQRFF